MLVPGPQGPITRVPGVRVPCPRVASPGFQFQSPRVQVSASQGLRVPGSQVSGPDFRLCRYLNNVLNKVNKTVGVLRKLQNVLSISTLVTIYKASVRPYLDYGDILFDQTYNL